MIEPASIWVAATSNKHAPPEDRFNSTENIALNFLREHFLDLYIGARGRSYSTNEILALSQHLSTKVNSKQKAECFNFLARGFEAGNRELDWDVPLAPVYITVKHEKTYSTRKRFTPIQKAEAIINAISEDIKTGLPKSKDERLGQILLTAIMFGGLINKKWIQPFWNSLINCDYYQMKGIFWIEMSLCQGSENQKYNEIHHRLVPDHLTRLLIYRLRQSLQDITLKKNQTAWNCVATYFQRLDLPSRFQPPSLINLLEIALARYITLMPHDIVGFACGDLPATSLPLESWLRCLTGKAIPVEKPIITDEEHKPVSVRKIYNNEKCKTAIQLELMAELLKELRRPKKGKISKRKGASILSTFRQKHGHELSPTFQLLIFWAERFLKKRTTQVERRNINAIRVSSIHRYLTGIGADLLAAAKNQNPIMIDPGDLELIYEEAAQRKPSEVLKIRQFHSFLTAYYNLPPLEWSEMLNTGSGAITCVSSNLIDEQIYAMLLESHGWKKIHGRWEKLRIIAIILMFRCGLRPSEIRGINLIDIQGITSYEILIRNTALNDTKSDKGVRRIPISELLTEEESIYLLAFVKERKAENHLFGDGLFLAHPSQKIGLLPDDKLYNPVRKTIKKITLDETIVLYHLRHSFLSWLSLQAQALDKPYFRPVIEKLASPSVKIGPLLDKIRKNEPWNRKNNYIFSALTGHASPHTSSKHYNHFLDLTLGLHLRKNQNSIDLNHQSLVNLTGCDRSTAFEYLDKSNLHPLQEALKAVEGRFSEQLRHPLEKDSKKIKALEYKVEKNTLPPWDEAIFLVLKFNSDRSPIAQKDLEMAAHVYEKTRAFDGRKIKTAKNGVRKAFENFDKRWGGITFRNYVEAQEFIKFLNNCKISKENLLIVHHPRYGQNKKQSCLEMQKWSKALKVNIKNFLSGEFSDSQVLPLKGQITLKILNVAVKPRNKRGQKMSWGFQIVIKALKDLLK